MIKRWLEYIKENDSEATLDIDAIQERMQELQDSFDESGFTGSAMDFNIECEDDICKLEVNIKFDGNYYLYEADFSNLTLEVHIMKQGPGQPQDQHKTDKQEFKDVPLMVGVTQILDKIEEDILDLIGIEEPEQDESVEEAYRGQWDSSVKEKDAIEVAEKVIKLRQLLNNEEVTKTGSEAQAIIKGLEQRLSSYDMINRGLIIEEIFYSDNGVEEMVDNIIEMGDKIMNKGGTEPKMVINAFDDAFNYLSNKLNFDLDELEEDSISDMAPDMNERRFIKSWTDLR